MDNRELDRLCNKFIECHLLLYSVHDRAYDVSGIIDLKTHYYTKQEAVEKILKWFLDGQPQS